MIARTTCMLVLIALSSALAAQSVTSVTPQRHDTDATQNTDISADFSTAMNTPAANQFRVRSSLRGWLGGSFSGGGTTSLTFNPTNDLLPGEEVEVVLTTGLQSTTSSPLSGAHAWRFRAESAAGPGVFTNAQHDTGLASGWDLEFGDLDNDGDLDAVAIGNGQSYLLTNDGNGSFTGAALSATNYGSYKCALADIESDGDLDIIVVSSPMATSVGSYSGQNLIYINDGSGNFTSTVPFGTGAEYSNDVDVGDLDGDGDVDFVVANGAVSNEANDIFINDGNGNFTRQPFLYTPSATTEVQDITWSIRIADFDNDGHQDVLIGNFNFGPTQSWVYLNDGAANFYWMSRVDLGAPAIATSVTTADFNADGHLDVAFGHLGQPSASPPTYDRVTILFNNGTGGIGSTSVMNTSDTPWGVEPVDIDADGDLDLAVGLNSGSAYIMYNNGAGQFTGSVTLGTPAHAMAFADVDGDGDLDAGTPDKICINGSNAPVVTVTSNSTNISSGATINVSYNDTLASLGLQIQVDDANQDNVSLGAQITNIPTQGIQITEFASSAAAAPYTLQPTSGTFNQGSVTHAVTLTADDGSETTVFTFNIVVGAAPNNPPTIGVSSNGNTVASNGTLNVAYGTTVASLALAINVTDPENDDISLAGAITYTSGTGILASEFSSAAQTTGYTLTPTSGTFNTASTTHVFTLDADDGNGGVASFTFNVAVGAAPTPEIQVFESSTGGIQISHGSSASAGRDFGSQLVSAGPTASLTVVIYNNGNADLDVSNVAITGADAGDFTIANVTTGLVAPSGTSQFTIAFDPNSAGGKTASIEITHNDGSVANPFSFEIAGVGMTPAPVPLIVVKHGATTIGNGGSIDFGSFTVGTTPAALTITIENAGNADLTVGTPTLSGADAARFSIIMNGFNGIVPASSSTSFHIDYDALVEGPHTAVLTFTHDDTTTANPFSINLSGTIIAPSNPGTGSSSGGSGGGSGGCVASSGTHTVLLIALLAITALAAIRTRRRTS